MLLSSLTMLIVSADHFVPNPGLYQRIDFALQHCRVWSRFDDRLFASDDLCANHLARCADSCLISRNVIVSGRLDLSQRQEPRKGISDLRFGHETPPNEIMKPLKDQSLLQGYHPHNMDRPLNPAAQSSTTRQRIGVQLSYALVGLPASMLTGQQILEHRPWTTRNVLQTLTDSLLDNPLFWPLLAVLAVLALLLPFTDLRALFNRLRSLLPGRSFERVYLKAIVEQLGRTPALLVISGRDDTRSEINLLTAFSQLMLKPEDSRRADGTKSDLDLLLAGAKSQALRLGRRGITTDEPRSLRQRTMVGLAWILAHLALIGIALALLYLLLWLLEERLSPTLRLAVVGLTTIPLWFLAARSLNTTLLPALIQLWEEHRSCIAERGTPGAEIWQHRRLLVRGMPGSGKTTLLRHIALVCASERLGLSRRWDRNQVRDAYGWPDCPFPMYIPLRALRLAAVQGTKPLLVSYAEILRDVPVLGPNLQQCRTDFFVKRAERGGCLILLDAFDELRNAQDRQRLGRLIAALPSGPPNRPNRIVVTSRLVGYEGQLDGAGFVHRRVEDLDDEQAAQFVTARYHALAALEQTVQGTERLRWNPDERAQRLIRRLPTNPGLRRLSRNPLLLSLAVSLHYRQEGRELPQERHLLYEKAVEMLAYEWERHKDADVGLEPTDESGDLKLNEKLKLLSELAWAMFEEAPTAATDAAHAITTSSRAHAVLARVLETMPGVAPGKEGQERQRYCRSEAERWLRDLSDRGGVLQELGNVSGSSEVEIQFAHLTFQEYLAARAIDEPADNRRSRRLLDHWDDPRLREVLLLYAATRSDATPVVRYLLDQNRLDGQLLAGYVLVERPRQLDQEWLSRTVAELRRLALEADEIDEATALEALQMLEDAGAVPERSVLCQAATEAPYPGVRARAIELLAGNEADQPAPDDLRDLALRVLESEQDYRPRVAAGFALSRGDPRYEGDGWIPELVEVPGGPFLMGSSDQDTDADRDERPQHQLELPTFWIGKTPVTNAQWRHFIHAGGYTTKDYWTRAGWRWVTRNRIAQPKYWDDEALNSDNQPVVGIAWFEAVAYSRWLSSATGQEFSLPTEAQWEKAARGPDGRIYPWGNGWHPGFCNSSGAGFDYPTPVGSFPLGASPYGVLDMAGNTWEWCATKIDKNYPYNLAEDEWCTSYMEGLVYRSLRGGVYWWDPKHVRSTYRSPSLPDDRDDDRGLRVASRSAVPRRK